jgi:hypothetical protein
MTSLERREYRISLAWNTLRGGFLRPTLSPAIASHCGSRMLGRSGTTPGLLGPGHSPSPRAPRTPVVLKITVTALVIALTATVAITLTIQYEQGAVTITDFGTEESSPPSSICNGPDSGSPAVPFTVSQGAHFNLSWLIWCWPGKASGSWTYTSLASTTPGFSILSSNLPVTITTSQGAYLNVTLAAPDHFFYGAVTLWAWSHAN